MSCPKCGSENIVKVGTLLRCQSCENYFDSPKPPAPAVQNLIYARQRHEMSSAGKIKRQAESFCNAAILFVGLGIIALVVGLGTSRDGGGSDGWWWFMGACFGAAFWLYLIGQIIHIRANTEK